MTDAPEIPRLAASLRQRFRRHNLHALALAAMSLLAAGVLWTMLYFVLAWLTLVTLSLVMAPRRVLVLPTAFNETFALGVLVLVAIAWVRRATFPDERARDSKPLDEHIMDVVLVPPSITLAIWSNLSAFLWYSALDRRYAARLLLAVLREKKVPMTLTPVIIPGDARREKVILGLLLIGLLELRHDEGGASLRLARASERELLLPDLAVLEEGKQNRAATPCEQTSPTRGE